MRTRSKWPLWAGLQRLGKVQNKLKTNVRAREMCRRGLL
jgi:hypothetical protein